ncbi:hypothetical protein N3K66_002263 [Trichothecium roseum]|uniref:Uncharacterized protein n=1 Tax=Trichothecium roseum TaxID=47278 RepID=A0ACC0V931_9HYPO|nr:hypothetical protein N3K66_002263 [Trichothecium roseum]
MDLAVTLIKSVLRAFYETREILIIDAVMLYEALRDDDLAYLMSTNTKDLNKLCGRLREDRFLCSHPRQETKPGHTRPTNRTWYYIDYQLAIDAIKWRVYTIGKEVQGTTAVQQEKKDYYCPHCKAEWTAMDVLDSVGPEGFICHRCKHPLAFEANRNIGGHEQSTRLNDQLNFVTGLLPQIDAKKITKEDAEEVCKRGRPVVRDATYQRAQTTPMESVDSRPIATKGLSNTGIQTIAVNITTSEGPTDAEKEAERQKKKKQEEANQLPDWIAHSTVDKQPHSSVTLPSGNTLIKQEDGQYDTAKAKPTDSAAATNIDNVFEQLKREQAAERAREEEEESEEDEGEFEDVPATGTGAGKEAAGTPPIKIETPTEGDSGERSAKRVKIEPEPTASQKEEDAEEDDDDELEFEDV